MAHNVAEPQVLLYDEGGNLEWHHRVLLRRLRDAVWVVLIPERDIQVENLTEFTLIAFPRGAEVPVAPAGDAHLVAGAISEELADHHAQAARLVYIIGGRVAAAAGGGPAACWRVVDTSAIEFGSEFDADLVSGAATGVIRGAVGLARCGSPVRWLFVEFVP